MNPFDADPNAPRLPAMERMTDTEVRNVLRVSSRTDLSPVARALIAELFARLNELSGRVERIDDTQQQ
jgi:phage terminase small subunit